MQLRSMLIFRRVARILVLSAVALLAVTPASAQTTLTVFMGSSAHAPLAVVFDLEDEENVYINKPEWETKPFYEAPYYSIRVGHGRWDLELIHDKMYLMNPEGALSTSR